MLPTGNAVVLGRHTDVWEELKLAETLVGGTFDVVVAVKRAGRDYDGPVHHWVAYHPELFETWIAERRREGRSEPGKLWTGIYKGHKLGKGLKIPLNHIDVDGGSSGLLGAQVALSVARRVVLCGIPMEQTGRYDDEKLWPEALLYRDAWKMCLPQMNGRTRSMSGWTQELLGAPTEDWLREEDG